MTREQAYQRARALIEEAFDRAEADARRMLQHRGASPVEIDAVVDRLADEYAETTKKLPAVFERLAGGGETVH